MTYSENPIACSLSVTANARKGIEQWFANEQSFIASESAFDVFIEKKPLNRQGNHSYAFFFDPGTNVRLAKKVNARVAVMECVLKQDGLLATGFHVRGAREPVRTNRRMQALFDFKLNRPGLDFPVDLYMKLRGLPIAEERSDYVKKRIESWEGYLQIAEKNADVEDLRCLYSNASFSSDYTKVRLQCQDLKPKNWKQLRGFSVKLGDGPEIGQVTDADKGRRTIEVELNKQTQKSARMANRLPSDDRHVTLSNFASLSQIRRLRKGFKDLQDGLAANANLEKLLFEERSVVKINNKNLELDFHNRLNEFQREAVAGAIKANDLYVIQGPPGTGKTTVISEICYQNAKAGLRTLVASQSNLAVDNALGRLLADPSIRILRYGRTESIEEEGRKFIEENVALHWRDATLANVRLNRKTAEDELNQLLGKITQLEAERSAMQEKKLDLAEQLKVQKELQQQLEVVDQQTSELKLELADIEQKIHSSMQAIQETEQQTADANRRKSELNAWLESSASRQQLLDQQAELTEQLDLLHQYQTALQLKEEIALLESSLASIEIQRSAGETEQVQLRQLQAEWHALKKLEPFEQAFEKHQIELPLDIILDISELKRLSNGLDKQILMANADEWKALHDRLQSAIQETARILTRHAYPIERISKRMTARFQTIPDIHEMVNRLGRFLVQPQTKQALAVPSMTAEKAETIKKIAAGLSLFYGTEAFVRDQGRMLAEQKQLALQVALLYSTIRENAAAFLAARLEELDAERSTLDQKQLDEQQQLTLLTERLTGMLPPEGIAGLPAEPALSIQLTEADAAFAACARRLEDLDQTAASLKDTEQLLAALQNALAQEHVNAKQINEEKEKMELRLNEEIAKQHALEAQLNPDVEAELVQLEEQLENSKMQLQQWEKNQQQLPVQVELQKEWETLLEEASEYDLDEIRKLYVEHANVIGTTCVASAAKTFMEDYPVFDVVIIDEVSKATPPELLLPMLKGKKIILVGDHHQLPPLVGQETLDELLEGQETKDQKELKHLLNESLFERLFRTLPKQNKTMLSIQYRMHERIMETISPFYREGNYQLQCGLPDSDAVRDHQLESPTIQRDDHLLWLDTPNHPDYFEAKPKGGTSRYNESELRLIRSMLLDLETATAEAKTAGRISMAEKKSVGIISFYGEQVKRIDHLIEQELRPKHLNCRTGSVDKFQGMEMDIIILSFVRNHAEASGDIGFAKDYRRLNVALSRSRELLVIVGSSEMFASRTKNQKARDMYAHLLETVQQSGRVLPVKESELI